MNGIFGAIGRRLGHYLTKERHVHSTSPPTSLERLHKSLRPADVLLIEGNSRISAAIKYLTQSTWSHAALFIGVAPGLRDKERQPLEFIESNVVEGVRGLSLHAFAGFHCRICRPVNLSEEDTARVIRYAIDRLGYKYDLKNIVDLARYLVPTPPVPKRWRRRMIAFGSGDPTKAICSALIAQAFQSVRYPILPEVKTVRAATNNCQDCVAEVLRVRHHSLYVPRDFDVSPYFTAIKPSLIEGFDYKAVSWAD